MDHHRTNLDDKVIHRLLASGDQAPTDPPTKPERPTSARERVLRWIDDPRPATENLDSLRTVVHHLGQAWERRNEPAVILLHHADLSRDLAGQMRRLADRLGIRVPRNRWPALIEAATFTSMRAKAHQLALTSGSDCSPATVPSSAPASPERSEVLNDADLAAYDSLIRSLANPDFVNWAENGTHSS
jgi:aryl sulfotransferase